MSTDLKKPINPVIIVECLNIMQFCMKHNQREKLMFWANFEGHVEWFEVRVSECHHKLKLLYHRFNLYDEDTAEVLKDLRSVQEDLKMLVAGKYSYEVKTTISNVHADLEGNEV